MAIVAGGCSTSTAHTGHTSEQSPPSMATAVPGRTSIPRSHNTVELRAVDRHPGTVIQIGSAAVDVTVQSIAGGKVGSMSRPGGGTAMVFPRYVPSGRYPRAVLEVSNAGAHDALNPTRHDFAWGAAFKLDAASEGRPNDNGNNLIQRGLFSQPTFFKAELDDLRPACAVRGLNGLVIVRAAYRIRPRMWYRLQCDRLGEYLRLRVWSVRSGQLLTTAVKMGRIGTLSTPSGNPTIPLSVGGKLKPDGRPVAKATDQFNGSIADPFVRIDQGF
jgi:hypothetical protein